MEVVWKGYRIKELVYSSKPNEFIPEICVELEGIKPKLKWVSILNSIDSYTCTSYSEALNIIKQHKMSNEKPIEEIIHTL